MNYIQPQYNKLREHLLIEEGLLGGHQELQRHVCFGRLHGPGNVESNTLAARPDLHVLEPAML